MTWIYFWLNIKMCANCVKMLDLLPQRKDWAIIIIIQDTNTNPIISLSWPDIISHCSNFSIIGRRHFLCRTQSARRQYDHHPCTCTHRCTLPSLVLWALGVYTCTHHTMYSPSAERSHLRVTDAIYNVALWEFLLLCKWGGELRNRQHL